MRSLFQLLLTILLNATWQIAVVAMFAACCSWLLRGAAAWCRHWVWVAAIVVSLCLPIMSGLSALKSPPAPKQNVRLGSYDAPVTRSFEVEGVKPAAATITANELPVTESVSPLQKISPINVNRNLAAFLVAFYLLFLLFRCFKLWRAWRGTAAIVRSAYTPDVPERAAEIIAQCQKAIGVRRVKVVASTRVHLPITAGIFNPLIILPAQLITEADEGILWTAIGHELVHVARRDYFLNLVYELIYLPLSFHPAAAFLRRRIKQTRELCCDELVARKLLAPEVYARSLVQLAGTVPLALRLAPDTTIGITDADILEVRIMSILKTSKLSARRNALLLIAAGLLLAAPCVAAAAFALQFHIDNAETAITQLYDPGQKTSQKKERAREELERKAQELEERTRRNPNAQGAELEAIRRLERELEEAGSRLGEQEQAEQLRETEQEVRELQERLEQEIKAHPVNEAQIREAQKQLAQLQLTSPLNEAQSRELQKQLAAIEKQVANAMDADQLQALKEAQEELAEQQENLTEQQRELQEEAEQAADDAERYQSEIEDRDGKKEIKDKDDEKLIRKDVEKRVRREVTEGYREGREIEQTDLARLATLSMDRAIQIATAQHPGRVLSCSLGRQKDGQVFYRLAILPDSGGVAHVWVSATDGRILKTEHD